MRTARKLGQSLVMVVLLQLAGCTRGPAPLSPVSGKVTYKGLALPTGTIVFAPDAARGQSGPLAYGKIDSNGSYRLYTGDNAGAAAGWYRITVTAMAPPTTPISTSVPSLPQSLLPEKYRDPGLSKLACEIKASRVNEIDFNLE
jgi:hypothetical protein